MCWEVIWQKCMLHGLWSSAISCAVFYTSTSNTRVGWGRGFHLICVWKTTYISVLDTIDYSLWVICGLRFLCVLGFLFVWFGFLFSGFCCLLVFFLRTLQDVQKSVSYFAVMWMLWGFFSLILLFLLVKLSRLRLAFRKAWLSSIPLSLLLIYFADTWYHCIKLLSGNELWISICTQSHSSYGWVMILLKQWCRTQ